MTRFIKFLLLFVFSMAVGGCDQSAVGKQGGSGIAIIDLVAIAKATGQDESIQTQTDAARRELTGQLQQLATNLEGQLQAEIEKLGDKPTEEDTQRIQLLNAQAQQQVNNAQAQAQQQAALFEQNLVNQYRDSIEPLAQEIARQNGAQVVITSDASILWFEPAIDITDEVIAAWRAIPQAEPSPLNGSNDQSEAKSEAGNDELAGTEELIDDLQEEIPELQ